jgi:hypothetical protein
MSNPLQSELRAIYNSLLENSESDSYCAQVVPGFSWARIATKGTCVALITPYAEDMALYNIELEHIKVLFNLQVVIQSAAGSRMERVSIIECKHSDPWLIDTFLELASMVLMSIDAASPISANNFLRDLLNLFRALNQTSGKSVQGLWGELFIIYKSQNPSEGIKSWHSAPNDRYDFARVEERIEVKTTTGIRRHSFSHEQLAPLANLKVTIASLVLNQSDDGMSCADMIIDLMLRIDDPEIRNFLVNKCVKILGADWRNQNSVKFDIENARNDLKWYDVEVIPKISSPIPRDVHAVKYSSDLQTTVELTTDELAQRGSLLNFLTKT